MIQDRDSHRPRQEAMRHAAAFFCVAVLAGCDAATSEIEGTWTGESPPTVQNEIALSESEGVVSGSGIYYISGPRPTGTFRVRGTFAHPQLTLAFEYDSGTWSTFNGLLVTSDRLDGSVSYTTSAGEARSHPAIFTKRME